MTYPSSTTKSRGQSTVEMLVAVAIATVILAYLVNFTTTQVLQLQERQAVQSGQVVLAELTDAINTLNTQPIGTQKRITLSFPRGIDPNNSLMSGKSLVLRIYGTDVVTATNASLAGTLPTVAGVKQLLLTRTANGVSIGTNSISSSAASIYLPMARDTNQFSQLTLTSSDTSAATLEITLSWNHTLVLASVIPAAGTISGNSTFEIDLNAAATASAIGNYTGALQINATFPDRIESFSIPVNVEVFSNTGALMNVVPSSLYFTTLGPDTNSAEIQICNASNTALKSIAFIPSTGNAGDWIQSITGISSLAAQSCTSKTITIVVPPSATYGDYSGSLAITDFSGANTQVVPIALDVFGQSQAFEWDWNGAYAYADTIAGFKMRNISSGTLTITEMTVSKWWSCDSNHSPLNSIRTAAGTIANDVAADDGEIVDVTDLDIGPNEELTTTNSMSFDGNISDEGEQFQVRVTFSDDSNYTSSVYGTGCALDLVPPATVTNLSATPGPSFRSVQLSFTSPGDDGFVGYPVAADVRFSSSSIDDQNDFNSATLAANYTLSKINGGNTGYLTVGDLNLGATYYFAVRFRDEAYNWSGISNTDDNKPFAMLSIAQDPSEFYFPPAGTNTTTFQLTNITKGAQATKQGRLFFHIDSLGQSVSYIVDVNISFDTNIVNRIRVWYPRAYYSGIDNTAADYDYNPNRSFANVDLLSTRYITNTDYMYSGLDPPSQLLLNNNSRFGIASTTGLADLNFTIDGTS